MYQCGGKLCVVSGGTSGVGLEAVKKLAKGGANIVLICRNIEKAESIRSMVMKESPVNIYIEIADFCRLKDVKITAESIIKEYPVIDVLINSAGIHSTKRLITEDGNELVFQVNHIAPFLLNNDAC